MSDLLDAFFAKYPRTHAVGDDIVDAVRRVESAGNDQAVSGAGARGPMQIRSGGLGLTDQDVSKPETNVEVGARYLDKLHKQFGGDIERVLRAYNQGPGNERKREGNAPKETREYPGKVLAEANKRPDNVEHLTDRYPAPPPSLTEWEAKYPVRNKNPSILETKQLEPGETITPKLTGFTQGLLGTAPDEISGSVLESNRQEQKDAAGVGFGINTALQALPGVGVVGEGLSALKGSKGAVGAASKAGQLGAIEAGTAPRSLNEVLKAEPYTLKSLEWVAQRAGKKGIISPQTIKDELNRPGISSFEKSILEPFAMQEGGVRAESLVQAMKSNTKDFALRANDHEKYADYGIDNIGRTLRQHDWVPEGEIRDPVDIAGTPAKTTTWQLSEGVSGNAGNHFSDPNYFGHTRSFVEDGVPHVVEVQSDLMQKKLTPMSADVRNSLKQEQARIEGDVDLLSKLRRGSGTYHDYLTAIDRMGPEIASRLGEAGGLTGAEELAYHRKIINDVVDRYAHARGDDWERIIEEGQGSAETLRQPIFKVVRDKAVRLSEIATKLDASGPAKDLTPMKKTHQQRLVKEELRRAADDGVPVRFASPDTVAKVEMWPDVRANAAARIAKREEEIRTTNEAINYPENSPAEKRMYERDLVRHEDLLEHDKKVLDSLGPTRFKENHQGIYENYKELEKYLKSIGGKEHTDKLGHTWIEVPSTGPKSPVKEGRIPLFTMSGGPIAGGTAAQYNTQQPEAKP